MRRFFLIMLVTTVLLGCAAPEKQRAIETMFYPSLPQAPKIQYLTSISKEEDIAKKQSAFRDFLLGEQSGSKVIQRPYDVGSSKDKIYVMDRETKKLIYIDLKKKTFGQLTSSSANFPNPSGIWISEDDMKYVADYQTKSVIVFDQNNKYLRSYGKDMLEKPLDVTVYGDRVYVCDFNAHKIIVFDKESGEVVQSIGEAGYEEGELFKPTHVAVDQEGNLYVNDAFNFRIQKFDAFGAFIRTYGYHSDSPGGFARPKGIAVSRENHLYVVDTAFENAQIFDSESGQLLLYFGGFGNVPGSMYLPSAMHIDYENLEYFQKYADKDFRLKYLIYVANQYGPHKLQIFGFGEWTGQLPD
jgi:hypothetical protein